MDKDTISRNLTDWIFANARGHNKESIREDHMLMEKGYLDSLGVMSLIAYVETLLGHEIPDELMSFENFESMQKIKHVFFEGSNL